jgi:putative Holliday junction resolvase
MARIVALDFGTRRCGVAVSDPMQIIASAHEVIEIVSEKALLLRIRRICDEMEAERIVVGLPLNMDGSEGPSALASKAFAEKLVKNIGLPVETWDERLSTKSAEAALIEAGTRREKRKGLVDKVAAQIILQHYLDSRG